jgi:hypothetical protein
MAPTKRKPGRPPTDRGRDAPQLPGARCSDDEKAWALAEMARLRLNNLSKLVRNKVFRGMPGYKPEV